jgi:ABC-2 type transport system ATP-binding protein
MTTPATWAIEAHGVRKAFGDTQALDGVDLWAETGKVLALLGPNGAGKTTLVRILTTLLAADSGSARVAGFDVARDAASVRSMIGLSGQFAAIDDLLTGRENLEMVGELYRLGRSAARRRAAEALEQFGLAEAGDRLAKTYSGGMRRRLDLAAGLIARPPILILDEPTTGLDPRTRLEMWELIERLVADGTTVLLTTQYLEEADRLAHRIVVIDRGRVVAEGTANELKSDLGGDVVELHVARAQDFDGAVAAIGPLGGDAVVVDRDRQRLTLPAREGPATLRAALDRLGDAGVALEDIGIRRPSLDDVFLSLTGDDAIDSAARAEQHGHAPSPPALAAPAGEREQSPTPGEPTHARTPPPRFAALSDIAVITRRNLKRIWRTPRLLAVSSIQPVMFVLLFRYVFGGAIHVPGGGGYINYLVPAILLQATLFGATTAVAMSTDLAGGMIDRFRSLPMARSAVLAGRALADMVRSTLVVALVLVVSILIGFRFHNGAAGAAGALLLALAFGFAFIWLFALVGMLVKDPETAQLAGFLPIFPLIFASSAFVPVQTMPGWLQSFANVQPVSVTIDAIRGMMDGGQVQHWLWQSAVWIIGILVVVVPLAVREYRKI